VKEEGKNKITTPKGVIESNEESKNFEITSKCTLQDETLISPRAIKCSFLGKIFYSWMGAKKKGVTWLITENTNEGERYK